MKADKREIVTFVIAALATLVAVWFFLGKMQKEKETVRLPDQPPVMVRWEPSAKEGKKTSFLHCFVSG